MGQDVTICQVEAGSSSKMALSPPRGPACTCCGRGDLEVAGEVKASDRVTVQEGVCVDARGPCRGLRRGKDDQESAKTFAMGWTQSGLKPVPSVLKVDDGALSPVM